MVLKRKRSDSELSFSSGSAFSSPPRPCGGNIFDFSTMSMNADGHQHHSAFSPLRPSSTPSHLPSRTMKRFRDNRPSDEEVHRKFYEWRAHHQNPPRESISSSAHITPAEHTLSLLYSAQHHHQFRHSSGTSSSSNLQQQQTVAAAVTAPVPPPPQTQNQTQATAQRSLHSFWNLPAPPTSSSTTAPSPPTHRASAPTHCEDCGTGLGPGAGDASMDVDGYGLGDCSCGACGRAVCFGCSVSNLGEQRRCLVCAGRRVWVGGIGWTGGAGVGVC